jgi:hypothetical protein
MNAELTENVQRSIRPGEEVDTYYYGETNSEKQAYPCIVNNKFVQQFTTPGQGTSQFVISPYQGVSDVVLYFKLPAAATITNSMLPAGWGYNLIRQVSVRYGSSAQYFFTGTQIYLQNLFDSEDTAKQNFLQQLGGNPLDNAEIVASPGPEAYVYLNLPHCSPRADGKPLPLPSDLLVQPIIVTIELNSVASLYLAEQGGGGQTNLPTLPLQAAQMQVKQEMMSDSADLLARRVDMNTHAYTFPLKYFPQQEVQINCANAVNQTINLTGFRAGEVRHILLWLTKGDDVSVNGACSWLPISQVQLTYNGEIFYRADSTASQIWNLICDTKSAGVNAYTQDGAGAWVNSGLWTWVDIPFEQVNVPYDKEVKLVAGKPILNAVVNLTFQTPTADTDYVLHAVYLYNSSLLMSRGSAEYIF